MDEHANEARRLEGLYKVKEAELEAIERKWVAHMKTALELIDQSTLREELQGMPTGTALAVMARHDWERFDKRRTSYATLYEDGSLCLGGHRYNDRFGRGSLYVWKDRRRWR